MTRTETRYGCFLSDLTGLARSPSTANLPRASYQVLGGRGQGADDNLPASFPRRRESRLTRVGAYKTHVAADAALAWIPAFAGMTVKKSA